MQIGNEIETVFAVIGTVMRFVSSCSTQRNARCTRIPG